MESVVRESSSSSRHDSTFGSGPLSPSNSAPATNFRDVRAPHRTVPCPAMPSGRSTRAAVVACCSLSERLRGKLCPSPQLAGTPPLPLCWQMYGCGQQYIPALSWCVPLELRPLGHVVAGTNSGSTSSFVSPSRLVPLAFQRLYPHCSKKQQRFEAQNILDRCSSVRCTPFGRIKQQVGGRGRGRGRGDAFSRAGSRLIAFPSAIAVTCFYGGGAKRSPAYAGFALCDMHN